MIWIALAALTLLRLAAAAWLPLSGDEAYYWVWSRALAWGYVDHPPMVALWIRLGTAIAGDTALGVRLLAPLATAAASVLLARAADALFPQERPGLRAAVLFNATLMIGAGAVTMTPDAPLLLFWMATLWAVATGRWAVAGLAAGLALDSKYTAALLAPSLLLWLATCGGWRRAGPWRAAALAALVFAPVLAWNAAHAWVSFAKQGGRVADWAPGRSLQFLGELLAGQVGLATPGIAVLMAAGAWRVLPARRQAAPALLSALIVVPSIVFIQHALGDRVQGNWPMVLYPQAAIAAAGLGAAWRRWFAPSVGLGAAICLAVTVQAGFAPLALPARADLTLTRLGGWDGLARDAAAARQQTGAAYLASDNYAIAARLAFAGVRVVAVEDRWRWFDLPDARAQLAGEPGLLLRSARRADALAAEWADAAPVGSLVRSRNGIAAEAYGLWRFQAREQGAPMVILPLPR